MASKTLYQPVFHLEPACVGIYYDRRINQNLHHIIKSNQRIKHTFLFITPDLSQSEPSSLLQLPMMSHIASFWKRKICSRIFRILAIFPQIHSLPFTDDLPSPLLSLFMKGPGRPEAQYYHQVFLSESINAEEIKSIDFFWISEIGCWFVRLLTMATEAEWRVMFQISERDFLPTSQMDLEDHSTTLNYIWWFSFFLGNSNIKTRAGWKRFCI